MTGTDSENMISGGYYSSSDRFPVSVDCIIFSLHDGALSVLLAPRRFQPALGAPSLMGGFVRADETLRQAAIRVLSELTGLDDIYMEQVGAFGDIDRDPGARVISVAYFALIKSDEAVDERVRQYGAWWVSVGNLPMLHFDHRLMIESALEVLRNKVECEPILFNLLPAYFTLAAAQGVCELILGRQVDKRNFRRRILETGCVERTDRIDKLSSRRGAVLYRFNSEDYNHTKQFKI